VTPVDKDEIQRLSEVPRDDRGVSDESYDGLFESRRRDGSLPGRQGVEPSVDGVNEGRVEVHPTLLVLLAAVVVIEGVEHAVRGFGRGAEVERGLSAPRAHFKPRTFGHATAVGVRELVEREALTWGHEALSALGQVQEFVASTHEVASEIKV
jgi:hypothetical protein